MEEGIDFIELLKRIKEGKSPKKIKVNNLEYEFLSNRGGYYREVIDCTTWIALTTDFNLFDLATKIKILDKSIIEEIKMQQIPIGNGAYLTKTVDDMDIAKISIKINEIIRHINKGGTINE